ncbi:MAG: DJ-1 family glyoxalase III [Opitutales bacterium]
MSEATTAVIVLVDGVEEMEAVTPIDLLRRAGVQVTLAALQDSLKVTGRNKIVLQAEEAFAPEQALACDCLILPGGPGTAKLKAHTGLREVIQQRHTAGRLTAAICAAPTVLHAAGVLAAHNFTAHFSVNEELGGELAEAAVVDAGAVVTSQGAGTALEFGLHLVQRLKGEALAAQVATSVQASRTWPMPPA